MPGPHEPFDAEAAQRADENRAHDIVDRNAPLHARGGPPPANQNQPLSPEEKRALFARYFPSPPTPDRERTQSRSDKTDPEPGSREWIDWLARLGSIAPPPAPERDREKHREKDHDR
jgi:hypothetical protein